MKRLFFLAAGVLSLSLLAFVEPDKNAKPKASGVEQLTATSFQLDGSARFTDENEAIFAKFDQSIYKVSNIQLSCGSSVTFEQTQERGIWVAFKEVKDENKRRQIWIGGSDAVLQNNPAAQQTLAILKAYK